MVRLEELSKIVFVLIVLIGACAYLVWFPNTPLRSGLSFGSDWNCIAQIKGDPVCYKRPTR